MRKYLLPVLIISFGFAFQVSAYDKTDPKEAKVLIERWRKEYNTFRPHSALGYLPPAPETVEAIQTVSATLQLSV